MPNPSTVHIGPLGVTTTSTAVASVNATAEAMFGRPFIVRHQYGDLTFTAQTVLTGNSSTVVHTTGFTTPRPNA
jgi:hypothetical protein